MTQPIKPAIDALWALHIPGPEELYAQPSEAEANAAAQRHNDAIRSQVGEHFHPDAHARAIIWPLDPASHAESLATGEAAIMSGNHLGVPDRLASAVMDAAALADASESPVLFDVDARAIPVLALFANLEEVTVNHILVMPHPDGDGVLLAATDCRHMAIWHDPQGKTEGKLMIPVLTNDVMEMIVRAAKIGTSKPDIPRYTYNSSRYEVHLGASCVIHDNREFINSNTPPKEGYRFPDPLGVIPKESELVTGLHGRIPLYSIRKFAKAAKLARKMANFWPKFDELSFWSKGDSAHGVIVARCQAVPNLLMFTGPVGPEVDGQRKPYVGGLAALHRETDHGATEC